MSACRLCGCCKPNIINIFDDPEHPKLLVHILITTGIHIKEDGGITTIVCQNCLNVVEKAYEIRMKAVSGNHKDCFKLIHDTLTEQFPPVIKHKSIANLHVEYPNITLPKQVNKCDIAPVITLDANEVTDWYSKEVDRLQKNASVPSVIFKSVSETEYIRKVINEDKIVSDNSRYTHSMDSSATQLGVKEVCVNNNLCSYESRKIIPDNLQVTAAVKKTCSINENRYRSHQKPELAQTVPFIVDRQSLLSASSFGKSPHSGAKLNSVSMEYSMAAPDDSQTNCIQSVPVCLSSMLPNQQQFKAREQIASLPTGLEFTNINNWNVDKLSEACKAIGDLKKAGELMSLMPSTRNNIASMSEIGYSTPNTSMLEHQRSASYQNSPSLVRIPGTSGCERGRTTPNIPIQNSLRQIENLVQYCAAPTNESLKVPVAPSLGINGTAYQPEINVPSFTHGFRSPHVEHAVVPPPVRLQQTASITQSITLFPNIMTNNHHTDVNTDGLKYAKHYQNRNHVSQPPIQWSGNSQILAQTITQQSLNDGGSIARASQITNQPDARYNLPSSPTASHNAAYPVTTSCGYETANTLTPGATNSTYHNSYHMVSGSNLQSTLVSQPNNAYPTYSQMLSPSAGSSAATNYNLPFYPIIYQSQNNHPYYQPSQNLYHTQFSTTSSMSVAHTPNSYNAINGQHQQLTLPQANYYLPIMQDEFIQTSFMQEPNILRKSEMSQQRSTMTATSMRTPYNTSKSSYGYGLKDVNHVRGANSLRSPLSSPQTFEQALQSYNIPHVDGTNGAEHERRNYFRIKDIDELK